MAYLYIESEGYMAFDTGQNFFKFLVPKQLRIIHKIKAYDGGNLVVDTNYGEEYIDLKSVADEIGLQINFEGINPILGRA